MKNNALKYFIFISMILFLPTEIMANSISNFVGDLQNTLQVKIASFYPFIFEASKFILYSLLAIELVIVFGFMAMKSDINPISIFGELIKIILIVGIFKLVLEDLSWLKSIFNGFNKLADIANGGTSPTLNDVAGNVGSFWGGVIDKVDSNGLTGLGDSILLIALAFSATIFILLMIARALQYYIFFLFSLYVGIFFISFIGFSFTRQWAYNAVINIIRQGFKWMMLLLVLGLLFGLINAVIINGIVSPLELLKLVAISIILWGFSNGIDSWVDSYFTGHGGGENNHAGSMLQQGMNMAGSTAAGAVGGAATGAMAGISAVKAQSATNSSTTPGVSSGAGSNFMKQASAGIGGAFSGATSGAVKGAMGFNTSNAGQKSGGMIGKGIGKLSNSSQLQGDNTNTNSNDGSLNGSISNSGGAKK